MRYVSYEHDGMRRVGVLEGTRVAPLVGIQSITSSIGTDELASATLDRSHAVELEEVTLLPASPEPRRIVCVGLNYHAHVAETRRDVPEYPVLFTKWASNLVGSTDPIQLPAESTQPDFEGELAVIIGRRGRRIAAADAMKHVLGFSVANDVTMRDFQYKTHQWLQGKAWDNSTPLGPAIVTPDEVDLTTAKIKTTLNGELMQDAAIGDLMFDIPRLIEEISLFTELEPGDVILTGTPGGVGFRRDPQIFLHPGDLVAVEIDEVGRIENRVNQDVLAT